MRLAALFFVLVFAGCATNTSICPKIRNYTQQEQLNQAAAEDFLPPNSPLVQPLLEWASLRAQLKACNSKSGG